VNSLSKKAFFHNDKFFKSFPQVFHIFDFVDNGKNRQNRPIFDFRLWKKQFCLYFQ